MRSMRSRCQPLGAARCLPSCSSPYLRCRWALTSPRGGVYVSQDPQRGMCASQAQEESQPGLLKLQYQAAFTSPCNILCASLGDGRFAGVERVIPSAFMAVLPSSFHVPIQQGACQPSCTPGEQRQNECAAGKWRQNEFTTGEQRQARASEENKPAGCGCGCEQ
eukprot:169713-Pelagomonas_calceolata.AAC.1